MNPSNEHAEIDQRTAEQAEMLANRVKKRHQHLRKWAKREGVEAFRLYDKDIPEVPLQIDIYGKYLHIAELIKFKDKDEAQQELWTVHMAESAARALGIPDESVFIKTRRQQKGRNQYEKFARDEFTAVINEGGLEFEINLSDYLDTGLFLDHRTTRSFVRDIAEGARMLNLFSYTGSFSVYAANGGALSTTSVDMSNTYSAWAKRNLERNGFPTGNLHRLVTANAVEWIAGELERGERYDLIVCDPPTFSNSKKMEGVFDVQKDHPWLIETCVKLLSKRGAMIFSNNFRKFKLYEDLVKKYALVDEITNKTIPEDFARRRPHRCWLIQKK
jgi:23S rRNA G2069 N7-methylase RlmK/C1962 C5-methylase RlmI